MAQIGLWTTDNAGLGNITRKIFLSFRLRMIQKGITVKIKFK